MATIEAGTPTFAPPGSPAALPSPPTGRFTVEQYHRLGDDPTFDPDHRYELLEGWIVPKMPRNPRHDVALALGQRAFQATLPPGWHLRGQSAVTTAESEPEPDLAIVRGEIRDYLRGHPGPGDLAVAIEISDSSLGTDRTVKARIYARAGVPLYLIVNLVERQVEVYADPTGPGDAPSYASRRDYREGESIPLDLDGREVGRVAVADLLP